MPNIVNTRRSRGGAVMATCHRCGSDEFLVLMVVIDGCAYCRRGECGSSWLPSTEADWREWGLLTTASRKARLAAAHPPLPDVMGQQHVVASAA